MLFMRVWIGGGRGLWRRFRDGGEGGGGGWGFRVVGGGGGMGRDWRGVVGKGRG